MHKKIAVIIGVLAFTMLITAAAIGYDWLSERAEPPNNLIVEVVPMEDMLSESDIPPEEPTAERAPDFALYDQDGNVLHLSDFIGKPIVLNFWATWCPSCVIETPYFEALYQDLGDEIHVIKVNLLDGQRETRERVDDFMAAGNYTFPLYFDSGDGAFEYGIRAIPMTFFIDAYGYLVAYTQGAVDEDLLGYALAMMGIE